MSPNRLALLVGLSLGLLAPAAHAPSSRATAGTTSGAIGGGASPSIDDLWLEQVVAGIAASEYRFTRGDDGRWSAPNRSAGMRTRVEAAGFLWTPLRPGGDDAWASLSLVDIGRGDRTRRLRRAAPRIEADRVEFDHGEVDETYVNAADGPRERIVVRRPAGPRGGTSPLRLDLSLHATGGAVLGDDGRSALLGSRAGVPLLRYAAGTAKDAVGRTLPTTVTLAGGRLGIAIDDRAAVYPLSLTPVITSPAWIGSGATTGSTFEDFGVAVASAGDVNGDGLPDVVIGADNFSNDQFEEGRAYLFLNSPVGLHTVPDWTAEGDFDTAFFGSSVAGGDINHDGYSDVIVGSPGYRDPTLNIRIGRVYGYLGGPGGLGPQAWSLETDHDQFVTDFGASVALGDVNADQQADIIVGAYTYSDDPLVHNGRVYVYLGSGAGPQGPVMIAKGGQTNQYLGYSVAYAGDVNGDGFGDVLAGGIGGFGGAVANGGVMLFRGGPNGPSDVPVWLKVGAAASDELGGAVAGAGDVDGDGFADILVSDQRSHAYLFRGGTLWPPQTPAWTGTGVTNQTGFGFALASAGDLNGDGFADVVIGEPGAAQAQVFLGGATGLHSVPDATLTNGIAGSRFGNAVAAAGDVNGDGAADLLVGANGEHFGVNQGGRAYVYLGVALPFDLIDPACLTATHCAGEHLVRSGAYDFFLNPDVDDLVAAQVRRTGIVTDGVTMLLLRKKSTVPVTFTLQGAGYPTLGALMDRESGSIGNSVTVEPLPTAHGSYAFAAYRAPVDFPGAAGDRPGGVTVTIASTAGGTTATVPLTLFAPPVVLVHGLWSRSAVWGRPGGGLEKFLQDRGFDLCPGCLVDYGEIDRAPSFDPHAPTIPEQIAVLRLVHAINEARFLKRSAGIAVSQVDVVGHSLGGLVARSRAIADFAPFRTDQTYGQGDFHKLITIGTPHYGSPLANWLLEHRCNAVHVGDERVEPTIADLLASINAPIGEAVVELQAGSPVLRSLGQTDVMSHTIVGIEPANGSFTEATLDSLIFLSGNSGSIDSLLGGDLQHDTIVNRASQQGHPDPRDGPDIPEVVHANLNPIHPTIGETESAAVWSQVSALLEAPLLTPFPAFEPLPAPLTSGNPNANPECPLAAIAPARPRLEGSLTLSPAPGTIVSPGASVAVTVSLAGGNPVAGVLVRFGEGLEFIDGPGPFAFDVTAPDDRAGRVDLLVDTFGPGPENYSATTYVVVAPDMAPASLSVFPSSLAFEQVGERAALHVTAHASDGGAIDVSAASSGTTYQTQSGGTTVVAVDAGGVVQATGPGQDALVVTHGGLTAAVPVSVVVTNRAPVFAPLAPVVVQAGAAAAVPVSATDPDGDPIRLAASGLTSFMTFTDAGGGSGQVTIQPAIADVGAYRVHLTVADSGFPPLGSGADLDVTVAPPCPAAPIAVPVLSVDRQGLSWSAAPDTDSYDVVRGDLAAFWISGDFQETLQACMASRTTATSLPFPDDPPPGGGFWILVRGHNCGGPGTWDDHGAGETGSRDYLDNSPLACP